MWLRLTAEAQRNVALVMLRDIAGLVLLFE